MRKDRVNIAAKFAVASELYRRDISEELSFQERGDLQLKSARGSLRVKVSGKQGSVWPGCRGIYGQGVVLVLVDFCEKDDLERPNFYLLTDSEWRQVVEYRVEELRRKGQRIEIDEHNVSINWSALNNRGQPYKGIDVRPSAVRKHLEKWEKIANVLSETSDV